MIWRHDSFGSSPPPRKWKIKARWGLMSIYTDLLPSIIVNLTLQFLHQPQMSWLNYSICIRKASRFSFTGFKGGKKWEEESPRVTPLSVSCKGSVLMPCNCSFKLSPKDISMVSMASQILDLSFFYFQLIPVHKKSFGCIFFWPSTGRIWFRTTKGTWEQKHKNKVYLYWIK